jgi:hypothetical protein
MNIGKKEEFLDSVQEEEGEEEEKGHLKQKPKPKPMPKAQPKTDELAYDNNLLECETNNKDVNGLFLID